MTKPVKTESEQGTTSFFTILSTQSAGTLYIADRKCKVTRGDIVLARENIAWHSDVTMSAITFEKDFFDPLFYSQITECRIIYDFMHADNTSEEHLFFRASGNQQALTILKLMEQETEQRDEYSLKMMHLLAVALVTYLDRCRMDELIVPDSTMVSTNRFGKIMKYIGDHYTDCTLQEVAEKFGYNPNYLSVRFRMITGETFSHKLLMIRLEQAQQMLSSTDLSVEQISADVGFKDKSWFIRKFHDTYGATPAAWRRAHCQRQR